MSMYLAARARSGKAYTEPAFRIRNLQSQASGWLSEVETTGFSHVPETAFRGYAGAIDAFLAATHYKTRVAVDSPHFNVLDFDAVEAPVIKAPIGKVVMVPARPPTDAQMQNILAKFGTISNAVTERRGRTQVVVMTDITNLPALFKGCKKIGGPTQSGDFEYNWRSVGACLILDEIVQLFLRTHTYPAYQGDKFVNQPVYTIPVNDKGSVKASVESIPAYISSHEKWNLFFRLTGREPTEREIAAAEKAEKVNVMCGDETVAVAKPSPIPLEYNLTSVANVPTGAKGLVFPYFDGMIKGDYAVLRDIISSHFLRLLGGSADEIKATFDELMRGIQSASTSPAIRIYAHIFFGMRLALMTQTRMIVVQSNVYGGFVLVGDLFSVYHMGKWHAPLEPAELVRELGSISDHDSALSGLAIQLSNIALSTGSATEGMTEDVTASDVSTSSKLWRELSRRKLTEDNRRLLEPLLRRVVYPGRYKRFSPENICGWLGQLRPTGSHIAEVLADDIHVYVPPTLRNLDDPNLYLLCTFGPDAPSLINAAGKKYAVDQKFVGCFVDKDDKGVEEWSSLIVHQKGVYAAYADLKKVLKEKVVMFNRDERAKGYRNHEFTEPKDVSAIARSILEMVTKLSEEQKGKRKADTEEGPSSKRTKPAVDVNLDDLDELF